VIVYRVTHIEDGKVYIGKWMGSSRPEERWTEHKREARDGSPSHLHNAIRKYGAEAFKLDALYEAKTPIELARMETFFIILHQSHDPRYGYNMTLGGDGAGVGVLNPWFGTHGPMGGKHHSEKSRRQTSLALKKKPKTEQHNQNVSKAQKLRWANMTPELRQGIMDRVNATRRARHGH